MRFFKLISIVAVGLFLNPVCVADSLEFPPLYGSTPDASVKYWIKYLVLGPQNAPSPIVWVAPDSFSLSGKSEFLIILPKEQYQILEISTKKRIAEHDCARVWPNPADWYTTEISLNDDGHKTRCVIPKREACTYFKNVLNLPIEWTSKQREPIDLLMHAMCEYSRTEMNK